MMVATHPMPVGVGSLPHKLGTVAGEYVQRSLV